MIDVKVYKDKYNSWLVARENFIMFDEKEKSMH